MQQTFCYASIKNILSRCRLLFIVGYLKSDFEMLFNRCSNVDQLGAIVDLKNTASNYDI